MVLDIGLSGILNGNATLISFLKLKGPCTISRLRQRGFEEFDRRLPGVVRCNRLRLRNLAAVRGFGDVNRWD
jgi:hypothetical protein